MSDVPHSKNRRPKHFVDRLPAEVLRELSPLPSSLNKCLRGTRLVVQSLCDLGLVGRGPL